jgi:hypothetical protein
MSSDDLNLFIAMFGVKLPNTKPDGNTEFDEDTSEDTVLDRNTMLDRLYTPMKGAYV